METLRHLLSYVFDADTDIYRPIKIWENPNDLSDFLVMTQLASRQARKREFNALAAECNTVVGSDGHCRRDATELIQGMYTNFKNAMRTNFSVERSAMPVVCFDATGDALGRGVAHCEIGSADFAGSTKQFRAPLAPFAQYEGSDKAVPLRDRHW
eukprot:6201174-Pleurochrysis_carterae.AAC.1